MSILDTIRRDSRFIYLVTIALVFFAAYTTVQLPLLIDPNISDFADVIADIEPGDNVYFTDCLSSAIVGDCQEPEIVILRGFVDQGADVIIWSMYEESHAIVTVVMNEVLGKPYWESPLYGEQVVYLGYIPGLGVTTVQHASSIRALNPTDFFGTPLDDLPACEDFDNAYDMDVVFGSGYFPVHGYAALLHVPYRMPLVTLYHSGGAAMQSTYYVTGEFAGYVAGVIQGAQLEIAAGIKGGCSKYAFVVTLVNAFTIIGMIGGLIYGVYFRIPEKRAAY